MKTATAQAQPNIALVKYWGKRDTALNIPAVGSLSGTLDSVRTNIEVQFDPALKVDQFYLNDELQVGKPLQRVIACLDQLRQFSSSQQYAIVKSHNNFPTSAGLASSASGFAALVVAAHTALDLDLSAHELCHLARQGSGSATRSLFGGFVQMSTGQDDIGNEAVASPILSAQEWPLSVVIAITSTQAKSIGSTEGMILSKNTSPYYQAWVDSHGQDMHMAKQAVLQKDFEALAQVSEFSCLKMHALAQSTKPGLLYWNGCTVDCIHVIRDLRASGIPVFFTIDAGPQVKAICLPDYQDQVKNALAQLPGVEKLLVSGLGEGASVCP